MAEGVGWREIGERVHEARLAAGLSQAALAARMGLERSMLAKVETGSRRLDALELMKLASALRLPVEHFLWQAPAVISRRHAPVVEDTDTEATRDSYRLEAELQSWLHDVRQVVSLGSVTIPKILSCPFPVADEAGAREAALWLRRELGLGTGPIDTLMDVCERAGQFVLVTDLPGDGASLKEDDLAVAVVSASGDPGRRRATGAHELGHLVVGDEYSTDLGVSASRQEREEVIDRFAAEFLLPGEVVDAARDADGKLDRAALVRLSALHRTSWSLTVKQAQRTGALNEDVRTLRARIPTRAELMEALGWAPQPDLESIRVPGAYAHGVMEAWRADLITSSRAIDLMHGQLSIEDLPVRDNGDLEP
jgi:transcriptional regulator with XRE-family HTH domain